MVAVALSLAASVDASAQTAEHEPNNTIWQLDGPIRAAGVSGEIPAASDVDRYAMAVRPLAEYQFRLSNLQRPDEGAM